jgi:hypothetical protein
MVTAMGVAGVVVPGVIRPMLVARVAVPVPMIVAGVVVPVLVARVAVPVLVVVVGAHASLGCPARASTAVPGADGLSMRAPRRARNEGRAACASRASLPIV